MKKDNAMKPVGAIKQRSSNLELYRIICMLMIVAHHYVVNSGLLTPLSENPTTPNSIYLWIFGMWGKTGINCFLMITGYFMCTSKITLRKFIQLLLWIYVYKIIIFGLFFITGYETISVSRILRLIMPVWGFNSNFSSCFIGFWLTIPFWNILIKNMTKKQHQYLLMLLLGMYTLLGSILNFNITFNYVTWFGVIYLVASYIRIYPNKYFENSRLCLSMTVLAVIMAILSVLVVLYYFNVDNTYFFVSDSNRILAVLVSVSSFLWFKNMGMRYNKLINIIGASTFGVLLIHANSNAMRQWLWKDVVDCVGQYSLAFPQLVLYSVGVVIAIFLICLNSATL